MMRRIRLVVVAVILALGPLALPVTPARADTYTYEGLTEGTFASWRAPSGNVYTAHRRMSVRLNWTTNDVAFRANVWCEVNGQPSTCTIYLDGWLNVKNCRPYENCTIGDFGMRTWDPVTTKTGHIFQGIDHDKRAGYSYESLAFIEVYWVAPRKRSTFHSECSQWVWYDPWMFSSASCA
jgi:hypothetical protein